MSSIAEKPPTCVLLAQLLGLNEWHPSYWTGDAGYHASPALVPSWYELLTALGYTASTAEVDALAVLAAKTKEED